MNLLSKYVVGLDSLNTSHYVRRHWKKSCLYNRIHTNRRLWDPIKTLTQLDSVSFAVQAIVILCLVICMQLSNMWQYTAFLEYLLSVRHKWRLKNSQICKIQIIVYCMFSTGKEFRVLDFSPKQIFKVITSLYLKLNSHVCRKFRYCLYVIEFFCTLCYMQKNEKDSQPWIRNDQLKHDIVSF